MILFKAKYTAASTSKSISNAISSVRLEENDKLFLKELSTQKKCRLFLQVGHKKNSRRSLIIQWIYLRTGGYDVTVPQEGIANDLGVSVRSIKRWVKELLDEGYINVRWSRNENGLNATSTMRITAKAWRELISIATNWCGNLKEAVRLYKESFKRKKLGGDTVALSTELKSGYFSFSSGDRLVLPKKMDVPKKKIIYHDIPF